MQTRKSGSNLLTMCFIILSGLFPAVTHAQFSTLSNVTRTNTTNAGEQWEHWWPIGTAAVQPYIRTVKFNGLNTVTLSPNTTLNKVINVVGENLALNVFDYSTDDKELQQHTNFTAVKNIDLGSYPTGIYLIMIIENNGNATVKNIITNSNFKNIL